MKKFLMIGLAALSVPATVMAEDVSATKKAAILTPIENLYGRVEARQTSMQWENSQKKIERGVASYRLVPRLGTKAFKDRLDVFVETPITNKARTSSYEQSRSFYQATFAAYSNGPFSVTPYSQGYLPFKGAGVESVIALNTDVSGSFEIIGGKLTLHGGIEPQINTGSKPATSEAAVVKNGALSLDENGNAQTQTIENREPGTTLEYIAGFSFTPSFAPKLSLTTDAYFDRVSTPTYELRSDETGDHVEKTGYDVNHKTLTDVVVAYKADKETTIQSLTRIRHVGFYEDAQNYSASRVPQIEQRISLIQKLF
jgi:hypothetical protein